MLFLLCAIWIIRILISIYDTLWTNNNESPKKMGQPNISQSFCCCNSCWSIFHVSRRPIDREKTSGDYGNERKIKQQLNVLSTAWKSFWLSTPIDHAHTLACLFRLSHHHHTRDFQLFICFSLHFQLTCHRLQMLPCENKTYKQRLILHIFT